MGARAESWFLDRVVLSPLLTGSCLFRSQLTPTVTIGTLSRSVPADRDPRLLFLVFMLFCCFEVFALGLIWILAEWLFGVLAWWTLILANLLAGLIMLGFFFRRHRSTWHEFLVLSA